MAKKTPDGGSSLEPWQIEDAARLKALFVRKKEQMRQDKTRFTQDTFAEENGFTSGTMVWQLLNAHRPLNIKAAAAFARGLDCRVEDFSPTLAEQISRVAETPRLRVIAPTQPRLQWFTDREAELLSEFRACAEPQKERILSFARSLHKAITDETGIDQGKGNG